LLNTSQGFFQALKPKPVYFLLIKKAQAMPELLGVERSSELSNQIVRDFKEIADLTYLISAIDSQIDEEVLLDKEA